MKNLFFFLLPFFFVTTLQGRTPIEKGLSGINKTQAEAIIGFLASDALAGREAGTEQGAIASEYLASQLKLLGILPLFNSYFQPFEAVAKERQTRGRFETHPDSVARLKEGVHRWLSLRNVLGVLEGKNKEEYVVVGAHYDHLGIDPFLEGDRIYNGADDNASGVSAVYQIAKAFLASGEKPERSVIFAFWDGEEKGLLGSQYFVQSFQAIGRVKGYLNFDMIGRNNKESEPEQVVYFYTAAHPVFGDWLKEDIRKYRLKLKPNYRPWDMPVGGSDNASFAKANIPVIWYHTDGHPDYHLPGDEVDKLNWEKLVDITKAAFLNVWNLANEKSY